jgi:glutamate-1-semialdehyde 2,1-aminomutase
VLLIFDETVTGFRLAYGGAQEHYVWFASSIGGNPVSAVAALATLAGLRQEGTYPRRFALGHSLRAGLTATLKEEGFTAQVQGDGPLAAVVFTDREVVDHRTAFDSDRARARAFLLGLFRRGIFLNPMSTKRYLSLAHTDADIERFLAVARTTLREDCGGG